MTIAVTVASREKVFFAIWNWPKLI